MNRELQYKMEQVRELLPSRFPLHAPLALVHSFGCQQNVADGEKLKGLLAGMGFGFTEDTANADLILYNTCAVREHAEDRVFGNVGALKKKKEQNPSVILGVCGCMVQQPQVAEKMKKSYPYVDLIFGTHVAHQLPDMLLSLLQEGRRTLNLDDSDNTIHEELPVRREAGAKAYLPIMVGCNNFCSYCIVPYVRGRERSRRPQDVLEEAKRLIDEGYKEITLLGQNVNSYGRGLSEKCDFPSLLEQLADLSGDFLLRFMTSHPKDASRRLIDVMAGSEKIERHLHLPVQSGNDRVLAAMNRHYTIGQYRDLVGYAKKTIPDLTLSTDIITGFPGETYEEFLDTLHLVEEVGYDMVYSFIYSRRSGTKAAEMDDPVPYETKVVWQRQLLKAVRDISERNNRARVGRTFRILVEGAGRTPGTLSGRTSGGIVAQGPGTEDSIGQFKQFKAEGATSWCLTGTIE